MPVAEGAQAVAEILDVGLLRFIDQHIAGICLGWIVAHLRDEARLRHVEVAAALVHFLARLIGRKRRPFGHDVEVGRDLQQCIEHQRPGLRDRFFHRQHANEVVAHAQMIALRFDIRICDLVVEKLRGLWFARNAPVVVVEQPSKETQLTLLIQYFNLHEVGKLPDECLDSLFQPRNILFDLRAQQGLHAAVDELRLQFR